MRSIKTLSLIQLLCLLLLPAVQVHADKRIVENVSVIASPEGPEGRSDEVVTWIGNQRYARIDSLNGITTIVRKDLNKMYLIKHDLKEAVLIDLPVNLPDYLQPLFEEVRMTWELNRLPEQKQIGQWNCTKVLLTGRGIISIDVEMWVSPETGIDTRAFSDMVGDSLQTSEIYREMGEKLLSIAPNFSIRTITTVRQLGLTATTRTEVESISDAVAPAGTYDPPTDYQVKQLNFESYLSLVREQQPAPGGR